MSECKVIGCGRPVRMKGLCNAHVQRLQRRGTVDADIPVRVNHPFDGDDCSIDGCTRTVRNRGLCSMHYMRVRNTGNTGPIGTMSETIRGGSTICSHPGCDRKYFSKGFCNVHYERSRSGRDMDAPIRVMRVSTGERCSEECNRTASRGPLCHKHYFESMLKTHDDRKTVRSIMTAADRCGMDPKELLRKWLDHGGVCDVCGESTITRGRNRLHVDHCHEMGVFRGFLCSNCNTALGLMKDDTARLCAAIKYLNGGKVEVHVG